MESFHSTKGSLDFLNVLYSKKNISFEITEKTQNYILESLLLRFYANWHF